MLPCTDDLKLSIGVSALKSPSAVLAPGLPLAWSHLIARPSSAFKSLSSPLSLPFPIPLPSEPSTVKFSASSPSHISAAPMGLSSHNHNVFWHETCGTPAVPSSKRNSVSRTFPFSTLGVGRALRDPLAQRLPDHAPGSTIISYIGRRCSVEAAWSNGCGEVWVRVKQASSACSADQHFLQPRERSSHFRATWYH